jgi:hypothetical protein
MPTYKPILSNFGILRTVYKIDISRLSSEYRNNDFPHAVFFTSKQKPGEIAL